MAGDEDSSAKVTGRGSYTFICPFCKMNFGSDVIRLALHIKNVHDAPRNLQDT